MPSIHMGGTVARLKQMAHIAIGKLVWGDNAKGLTALLWAIKNYGARAGDCCVCC